MAIDLSVHTMKIGIRISPQEQKFLCKKYNFFLSKQPDNSLSGEVNHNVIKIAGINQIRIDGYYVPAMGGYTYNLAVTINAGRLIRKTNNAMLVLTKKNVDAIFNKLSTIFDSKWLLTHKHSNPRNWNIKRIDCGIDLKLCTADDEELSAIIRAMHDSFDENNSRGVQLYATDKFDTSDHKNESITLCTAGYLNGGNLNYKYNIYIKLFELIANAKKEGRTLTPEEIAEVKGIIRIEKQIDAVSKIFGRAKLEVLLDEDRLEKVMDGIVKEINLFFGKETVNDLEKLGASKDVSKMSVEEILKIDYYYTLIERYGCPEIPAPTISKDVLDKLVELGIPFNCQSSERQICSICTLLDDAVRERTKPRKKGKFSKFVDDPQTGRLCINPTIFKLDDPKYRIRMRQKVDESREDFELSVFERIRAILNQNYKSATNKDTAISVCEHGYKDFSGYSTVVESQIVKEKIKNILMKIEQRQEKLQDEIWIA